MNEPDRVEIPKIGSSYMFFHRSFGSFKAVVTDVEPIYGTESQNISVCLLCDAENLPRELHYEADYRKGSCLTVRSSLYSIYPPTTETKPQEV
ncbi:MAG: hypothetical protein GVY20_02040 [Bacteroidetes bacterium]|jgi:hypothetical protein|nr:hypothetical protein [Bacteroidota bacterium]